MRKLLEALGGVSEYTELLEALLACRFPVAAGGLNSVHKSHVAAALAQATGRPLLIVAPDDVEAGAAAQDVAAFLGVDAVVLPTREFVWGEVDAASRDFENRRIAALDGFLRPDARLFVASAEALRARTLPRAVFEAARRRVTTGGKLDMDEFADALVRAGYRRASQVEGAGQFAIRGGIVDVFSPSAALPYRIELWGDEVDTIATFDPVSQRRLDRVDSADVLPSSETLPFADSAKAATLAARLRALGARLGDGRQPLKETLLADAERLSAGVSPPAADRWLDLMYDEFASPLDYLPENTLVVVLNHGRAAERAAAADRLLAEDYKALLERGHLHPKHINFYLSVDDLYIALSSKLFVYLDSFIGAAYPVPPKLLLTFQARQLPSYGGSLETAVSDVRHYLRSGLGVVVLCRDSGRARRMSELLLESGVTSALDYSLAELPERGRARIALGAVQAGFEYPSVGLAVISEGQIIPSAPPRRTTSKRSGRGRVMAYTDLVPGDYVVHEHHGVARFVGIVTMEVDGAHRDYVKLAFLGKDALYVPATQLDLVSKYIGGGEDAGVRLSKLGGAEWKRSKSRAKSAARELAAELIDLYAARVNMKGYAFAEDDEMQRDFEGRFEFDETDDQLVAAREIKGDMQKPHPMDRLLCGDVGFGKTEVALRAAMKAIISGKQVAFLVPTTVLCQQHFLTAQRRFSGYPVTIDVLSRFRTAAQQAATLKRLQSGRVDLVIGTHRLLQKDVVFKNIGLLIVDEEQRFGVSHKERIKEMSRDVDVLTLSATPIPRTLNMALSGIRDMSSLEEAPLDRHPVQTYVMEQDSGVLLEACRREIARGGQVYYLHNRIETIDRTAKKLAEALPDVNVAVAHGQMGEAELAEIMLQMEDGRIQILVCTTIIETGIDISNVNTLIVEDADKFGLAQLHQLRGRVGRSRRHAYAYLCYRRGKVLSELAEKRLLAIREFAEFGAGFKIAMRDLEIRGAGNVLGHAQSGHMLRVGYDMYLKLLEEAVSEEKGEAPPTPSCTADLMVTANIPESYVSDSGQRMDLYRRIAAVRTEEDASDLVDELCDRYGDMPKGTHALIRIARLRFDAAWRGISEISQKDGRLVLSLASPDFATVARLCGDAKYKGRLYFSAGGESALTLKLKKSDDVLNEAEALVRGYTITS